MARMWGAFGQLKGNDPSLALQIFTGNHGVDVHTQEFVAAHGTETFFSVLKKSMGHGLMDHINPLAK